MVWHEKIDLFFNVLLFLKSMDVKISDTVVYKYRTLSNDLKNAVNTLVRTSLVHNQERTISTKWTYWHYF